MFRKKFVLFITTIAVCMAAAVIGCGAYVQKIFLPHSFINAIDVSSLSFRDAEKKFWNGGDLP